MVANKELCIEMPSEFPSIAFSSFMSAARSVLLPDKGDPWKEFAGASNLIGWRFRSCHDSMMAYIRSWQTDGSAVAHDTLYQRERELFVMYASGASCIESVVYAIHALASHPAVRNLPFGKEEQRRCSPDSLCSSLRRIMPQEAIVSVLSGLLASPEWKEWKDLRNRMAHRSNLPMRIDGAVGGPPPQTRPLQFGATSSTPPLDATEAQLRERLVWLASTLGSLLQAGGNLVSKS